MPGAREKIIVYITHFLVVERSYSDIHLCFWKGKSYVEGKLRCKWTLINKIILAIHPVLFLSIFQ